METFRGQANSTYHFTYLAELVKSDFGIKASWFDCAQGDMAEVKAGGVPGPYPSAWKGRRP